MFFFFFQAEDGIRDYKVTGVQTCALPIWIRHEELEQRVLGARERDHALGSMALHRVAIECDVQEPQDPARLRAIVAATPERSDAREELVEGERLHEGVIRAGVQPLYAVADGRARGQHQD